MIKIVSCLLGLGMFLIACVSTTDSRFSKKINHQKALENYTQLGLAYYNQGQYGLARKRLNKALTLDEQYAPAHRAMALLLLDEDEKELAERSFLQAIRVDPDFSQAQYDYSLMLLNNQRYSDAEPYLFSVSKDIDYPYRAKAFYYLGQSYQYQDKIQPALLQYKKSLRLHPFNGDALLALSNLLFKEKAYKEADEYYSRLQRLVDRRQYEQTAKILFLGIQLARVQKSKKQEAKRAFLLKKTFPESEEYQIYLRILRQSHTLK